MKPTEDSDVLTVDGDLADLATADRIVSGALGRFGRIDALPLGRVGEVSDVVDGILFLEASPYITGEILHIDGGQIAGH